MFLLIFVFIVQFNGYFLHWSIKRMKIARISRNFVMSFKNYYYNFSFYGFRVHTLNTPEWFQWANMWSWKKLYSFLSMVFISFLFVHLKFFFLLWFIAYSWVHIFWCMAKYIYAIWIKLDLNQKNHVMLVNLHISIYLFRHNI